MARSYLLYGPAGTRKTSFVLIDAEPAHPISFHELEAGGFDRAAKRLRLSEGAVLLHRHPQPFNNLDQISQMALGMAGPQVDKTKAGNAMPQLVYELDGWVDMFSKFNLAFQTDIRAGMIPVIDTATRLWLNCRNFYNELTEKMKANTDNLGQLKFTEPKSIHLSLLEFPKAYGVDSVWIAHEEREFGSDPPKFKADCMAELPNNVDITLRFRLSSNGAVAEVMKGGEAGNLVGMEIPEPTLKRVNAIFDVVGVLDAEGEPYEKDADVLLDHAKLRGLF